MRCFGRNFKNVEELRAYRNVLSAQSINDKYMEQLYTEALYKINPTSEFAICNLKQLTKHWRSTYTVYDGDIQANDFQKACIFAHNGCNQRIQKYVVRWCKELVKAGYAVIFLTDYGAMPETELKKIKPYVATIITRSAQGRDFGSWSIGLKYILPEHQYIITMNDSCYGPMKPLMHLNKFIDDSPTVDFFGLNSFIDPDPIYGMHYYFGSSFLIFKNTALAHPQVQDFFQNLPFTNSKMKHCHYEHQISEIIFQTELSYKAYMECHDMPFEDKSCSKILYREFDYLWQRYEIPILKRKHFREFYRKKGSHLLPDDHVHDGGLYQILSEHNCFFSLMQYKNDFARERYFAGLIEDDWDAEAYAQKENNLQHAVLLAQKLGNKNAEQSATETLLALDLESVFGQDNIRLLSQHWRTQTMVYKGNINPLQHQKICVFAHYDEDHHIKQYIIHHLKFLLEWGCAVIFVSSCETISESELNKIRPFVADIIIGPNQGYDFGSYAVGFEYAQQYTHHTHLVIMNDSIIGPIYPLAVFDSLAHNDVVGNTDSYTIKQHLQSYFIIFRNTTVVRSALKDFFSNVLFFRDLKWEIIHRCEIGLSQHLIQRGFALNALCSSTDVFQEKTNRNSSHEMADVLIKNFHSPFIKVSAIREHTAKILKVLEDHPQREQINFFIEEILQI